MERHRCTSCRNPIRNVAVARRGTSEDAWYHPDCWQHVCAAEQEGYERQVASLGLEALLAPYVSPGAGERTNTHVLPSQRAVS